MNYAELTEALLNYSENFEQSFVANIPLFVRSAEERIYNTVQLPALRRNMVGNGTAGSPYLQTPFDFLAPYSLAVIVDGEHHYLLNKDVNFIRQAYPREDVLGIPKYYALWDADTFIMGPTPETNIALELHFYYYPPSIVDAGTSWLGNNFETVLMFGALVEACIYMKPEQDLMQLYDNKYKEALGLLKRLGDGMDRRDAYRSGQLRMPVT